MDGSCGWLHLYNVNMLQDLNAYTPPSSSASRQRRQRIARPMPSAEEVSHVADFKNVGFLERFLTPAGKIMHRCACGSLGYDPCWLCLFKHLCGCEVEVKAPLHVPLQLLMLCVLHVQ